jgi:hypothetical protein
MLNSPQQFDLAISRGLEDYVLVRMVSFQGPIVNLMEGNNTQMIINNDIIP